MRRRRNLIKTCLGMAGALAASGVAWPQTKELTPVVAKAVYRTIELPGEFQPFQSVAVHAKVRGYVARVLVDRGSAVKRGQLLAELTAPEMRAQIAEAESKAQAAEAERLQAVAQLAAAQSTAERLQEASQTPGAIAGNELIQAQKEVEGEQAAVQSKQQASRAAEAMIRTQRELAGYLRITAPFDGMVTERLVHPGALVGPGSDPVLLVIQEVAHLRLVVAVPEENIGGMVRNARVEFRVPAYPEQRYSGTLARISHAMDEKTRTMAVELDVFNRDGTLSPGMYPVVKWPVRRLGASLWVPKTSVVTTTERTFVIRRQKGHAEWVDVRRGSAVGDQTEVWGNLQAGELVVRQASDEIREGSALQASREKK